MYNERIVFEAGKGDSISIEQGLARAIPQEEKGEKHYQWATTGSPLYEVALRERIKLPYENGLLVVRNKDGSIKFDDRKLRFSRYRYDGRQHIIQIAPTHFGEIRGTDIKAAMDSEHEKSLLKRGKTDFENPEAYFGSSIAVNSLAITREGYLHVFKRGDTQELLPGKWDVHGGFVEVGDAIFNLHQGNMSYNFMSLLEQNVRKELAEESGNKNDAFSLMGLVKGVNFVFSYRANLDVSSEDFIARHSDAKDASEVGKILVLKNRMDLERFLQSERKNSSPTAYQSLKLYSNQLVA